MLFIIGFRLWKVRCNGGYSSDDMFYGMNSIAGEVFSDVVKIRIENVKRGGIWLE